jgi:hypothetical protein
MDRTMKYMESSHMYSTKFMRNSKAVGVLWGIFSVCYAIIVMVVFTQVSDNHINLQINAPVQDEWMGDGNLSKISGNFGLWRWCVDR